MSTAIEFENVGKQYRLGLVSTQTLSHDLNRWWQMNILHREDPYLRIGDVNDRSAKGSSDYVWALRDINFKVEQGDVVGIIGRNGAGKSTLLKLLSKVTGPTTGQIRARGRIGSLLEVGTGFHPEMTGRENIFMNGAILGMTKAEVARKLDEIVDFSGCERYLDTPVKRYSSGMMVRLGFAVAAHLDPEILVVDEVLAVGDAEFQKKAIGKMKDVSQGEGRTVLFVSHNMTAMRNLCKTGVWLENGLIRDTGMIGCIVENYLGNVDTEKLNTFCPKQIERRTSSDRVRIIDFTLLNQFPQTGDELIFEYKIDNSGALEKEVEIAMNFKTLDETPIMQFFSKDMNEKIVMKKGYNTVRLTVKHFPLVEGDYLCSLWVGSNNTPIDWVNNCFVLHMENGRIDEVVAENRGYPVVLSSEWTVSYN